MARVYRRFPKTGFTRNRPRKVDQRRRVLVLCIRCRELASKNRRISAASIGLEVAEVEGSACQYSDHMPHTEQVGLHDYHPRRKPLLKRLTKKACKQFAEDNLAKSMKLLEPYPVV